MPEVIQLPPNNDLCGLPNRLADVELFDDHRTAEVVVTLFMMNHLLPQLFVSQISKFETLAVNSLQEICHLQSEKETPTTCSDCSYENLAFSSSFNKFSKLKCSPICENNCNNIFDSYHQPMVLPTSTNPNNNTSQQSLREFFINSLFQNVNESELPKTEPTQNYFQDLSEVGTLKAKNLFFPDKNRKNISEKKQSMTIPQHQAFNQNSFFDNGNSSEEEDNKSRKSTSSSCLSNSSAYSNQSSSNIKRDTNEKERSWRVLFESDEYRGLLRNTTFKIKTRTDDIETNISSQLYSSLKYQFNISTFVNKKRATELAINQKSCGGIIIATIESLVVRNEDENIEHADVFREDVLKGESELALQPIESIEATESKAFKPFLQQLRRDINKEDNDFDERDWVCLLNKTKMQFSDQSLHNKKNSYALRVSFYLNKEFKERKPIIIFESAPFKVYARRSKRQDENEEPKKRKRKTKTTDSKKHKSNDSSLLSKFESELVDLVRFISYMPNSTEKERAIQSFITNLVDSKQSNELLHPMFIDTSFGNKPITPAKPVGYPFLDTYTFDILSNTKDESFAKDMFLSIGQSSVLDSPHTPDTVKESGTKPLLSQNQPPNILQVLNQPSTRLDLSKAKNIGSMNPSMLNKYLQEDIQTPITTNPTNSLIGMDNSLDIFDVSPLPIQGNNNNGFPNESNTFDHTMFDLSQLHTRNNR